MRDRVTFCIKTIHRPQCCATLVRSIYEHCGDDRPLIYVLDDGKPELRFSQVCPDEAALVDRLIETEFDIGLSAGRNRRTVTLPSAHSFATASLRIATSCRRFAGMKISR